MRLVLVGVVYIGRIFAGSVSGTVADPAGQPVAAAQVTVFSRDNRIRLTTQTDSAGAYRFADLPAGEFLLEAATDHLSMTARPVTLAEDVDSRADLILSVTRVRTEVLVTANAAVQSTDEVARAVDVLHARDLSLRAEYSLSESVQTLPGLRVQSLGGPGSFTRILFRGLRAQDTGVTIDGLRFRDAATTQGDASTFLESLLIVNSERVEVLRGGGTSLYGTHAVGGVINVVTDEGGGETHGDIEASGGDLGFARGLARVAGSAARGQLLYSLGAQHTNVSNGIDGKDRFRNTSLQGYAQFRPGSNLSLSTRIFGGDGFSDVNDTPFAAASSALPPRGTIRAIAGSNFTPNSNDPDRNRASRFAATSVLLSHQLHPRASYRISYQNIYTRRLFEEGPAGAGSEPAFLVEDRIRGRIDTAQARTDLWLNRASLLSAGYEWEREDYLSRSRDTAPPPATLNYQASAVQRSHAGFVHSQNRLLADRLQVSLSARGQHFDLDSPAFRGAPPVYAGLVFQSPPNATTLDASAAWFQARTGTKLRAHAGNGYRAPSLFERFGASFFSGAFTPQGDPRLRPDRSFSLDFGIDQYLFRRRLRLSATQFYTDLREVIIFDTSGFIIPATDPFRRNGGYMNTGGGIARGMEVSAETALPRRARVFASYTYANSDQRRSTVRDNDFFQTPFISSHQFTAVATVPVTTRFDITADAWIVSKHPTILSRRAFLFDGARKVDLVGNYTIPVSDKTTARVFLKVSNVFDSTYFENGFRTPGAWAIGGLAFRF